ncbi:MAG: hypothetical protein PHC88_00385 [Terrimicrobiaceae bacterium]|nr:hypothetical protein [Terrimicrobiaceae bacterium]
MAGLRAQRSPIAFPAFLLSLFLVPQIAFADGGAVLAQEVVGACRVTLFGSPAPLRAGPADLSVMLQDAATGAPILDRSVTIQIQAAANPGSEAWVPPCCSMKTTTDAASATHAGAQNKLLYAANVLLSSSGPHEVTIRFGDGGESLHTQVAIQPPAPPLAAYWAFLAAPPLLIAGFALNQRLRRRPVPSRKRE